MKLGDKLRMKLRISNSSFTHIPSKNTDLNIANRDFTLRVVNLYLHVNDCTYCVRL